MYSRRSEEKRQNKLLFSPRKKKKRHMRKRLKKKQKKCFVQPAEQPAERRDPVAQVSSIMLESLSAVHYVRFSRRAAAGRAQLLAKRGRTGRMQFPEKNCGDPGWFGMVRDLTLAKDKFSDIYGQISAAFRQQLEQNLTNILRNFCRIVGKYGELLLLKCFVRSGAKEYTACRF